MAADQPGSIFDVAVVGAGPAGSATARLLALKGWRVTLLERSRYEAPRVAESLAPNVQELLHELGVWSEFQSLQIGLEVCSLLRLTQSRGSARSAWFAGLDCQFRLIAVTDSAARRLLILREAGRLFRAASAPDAESLGLRATAAASRRGPNGAPAP